MRLMPITAEDEDLAVRLECDPGRCATSAARARKLTCELPTSAASTSWSRAKARMYKIVAENSAKCWDDWHLEDRLGGPQTYEMGWFVLPEHQGKGIAPMRASHHRSRPAPILRSATSTPIPPSPTLPPTRSLERSAWKTRANSTTKASLACCAATIGESTFVRHLSRKGNMINFSFSSLEEDIRPPAFHHPPKRVHRICAARRLSSDRWVASP